MLTLVGTIAAAFSAGAIAWLSLAAPQRARYPWHGWCGLAGIAILEALLAARQSFVTTFFTPLIWTAYIAAVDGAVYRLRDKSLLRARSGGRGGFCALALLSIPAWLVFEAFNLKLRNWVYTGVPANFWSFALGAGWSFATIFAGIFETANLIQAAGGSRWRARPLHTTRPMRMILIACGAAMLVAPVLLPATWAPYAFAPVWGGFVLLLDPLNYELGADSLLRDWERGHTGRTCSLLLSGAVCGFLWEFWNFWAQARWWYVFPILRQWRIFAMPAPGFFGFPPFALECFAMSATLSLALLPRRLRVQAVVDDEVGVAATSYQC